MTTFVNQTKSASSWANGTQDTSTFSNQTRNFSSFWRLLMEDGSYLLLETGDKIILEQSPSQTEWANLSES